MTTKKPAAPKSSPLPWQVVSGDGMYYLRHGQYAIPRTPNIARAYSKEDALLIKRRVNQGPAFDAMVEALKMAIDAIEGEWPGLWDQGRAALKLAQEAK